MQRIDNLIERVSAHFDGYFGIRFALMVCQPWEDRCVGRPANESLIQLFKVEPESAELVVGFTVTDKEAREIRDACREMLAKQRQFDR